MAIINGTAGSNIIVDPAGTDTINALGGNDTIRIANGNFGIGETIDGGSGTDTIDLTSTNNTTDFSTGVVTNVERLKGGNGNDTVTMSVSQYTGFDSINLGSGSDTLNVKVNGTIDISGANAPSLSGIGNRNLIGSSGIDTITLKGSQLNAFTSIDLGAGATDTINLRSTSSRLNDLSDAALKNVEIISASAAADDVTIDLSNQTEGLTILGSNFSDTIIGGSGNDTIVAGLGNDRITGGAGADKFVYQSAAESSNSDTITDFQHGVDKIDLTALLGAVNLAWGNATPTANGVWVTHTGSGNNARTHVWADTNGTPGSTELHITLNGNIVLDANDFLGVGLVASNVAPVLTGDLTATVLEGGTYAITTTDLNFSDTDDDAAGVTFTVTSQVNGVVLVGGVPATSFTGTQLAANQVSFQHNGSETTSASFNVSVEDGNEDGSAPVAQTFNLTVTPVNDAPVLTGDLAATILEGGTYPVTTTDLNFTDTDDNAAGVTFSVTSQVNGVVLVGGVPATSFTGTQLAANQVSFQHNGSETTTASFNVSVEDGNEDNSAPVAQTFNLTVTPVNDAPVLTGDLAATILEGGTYPVTTTDLNFTDTDDNAAGVTFSVTSQVNGVVLVGGVPATSFTGTQLAANQVSFQHNGSETTSASFNVSVEDGNEDGSAPVAQTFNLTVTPVNDAPVLTGDLAATILEGGTYPVTTTDLNFTDTDDNAAGVTFSVTSQVNGVVLVGGVPATSFTGTQLAANQVSFQHNGSETTSASFNVSVEDGNEDNSAPVAQTFNLTVTPVNDAPVLTGDLAATVLEGGTYAITTTDLNFSDPDDNAAGVSFAVTSQVNGVVLVGGVPATSFTGTQLAANQVSFQHNGSETTSASFNVSVEDGNEDGSVPVAQAFNFTVMPVNDAPVLTGDLAVTVLEGGSVVIGASDLGYSDQDDNDAGVAFTVSDQTNGKVQVSGVDALSFTGAQLVEGLVTFLHNGSDTTTASFKVSVEDGNEDSSTPSQSTFNLTVTPVNDAPTAVSFTNTTTAFDENTDTTLGFKVADIVVTDDALGTETLGLTGADAASFEIVGSALYLKAGVLDFEAKTSPANQVDVITLGGPTYRDDQWTLNVTGPITASLTYTVVGDDEVGANIYNVTQHWGAAINSDPTLGGFLTASYFVWDGVTIDDKYLKITLTEKVPGVPFSAAVSVFEASQSDNNETQPLTVSINTVTEAFSDPEPAKIAYSVQVTADDPTVVGTPDATSATFTVHVNNLDEVAPTITSGVTAAAISENSGAGQVVYTATSTDTGDIATGSTSYSLKAATGDVAAFSIDNGTGAVTLTGNPDFETKSSYSFTVVATDTAGNHSERAVSLAINDVYEVGSMNWSGSEENDTYIGNSENNTMKGGAGNDTLNGGDGYDIAMFSGNYADYNVTTNSVGVTTVTHNGAGTDGTDTLTNVELLEFADRAVSVLPATASGISLFIQNGGSGSTTTTSLPDGLLIQVFGMFGPASTTVTAGSGNDTIIDGGGWDTLFGGAGNDLISGSAGIDSLWGGDGNDILAISWAGSKYYHGDSGIDTVDFSLLTPAQNGNLTQGGLTADLSAGTIAYLAQWSASESGPSAQNVYDVENVIGGPDGDNLTGSTAANMLSGGLGDDTLKGGLGNDVLIGGSGNDTLTGGTGDDYLVGSDGDDLFVFANGDGNDKITDFTAGAVNTADIIDVAAFGFADFAALQAVMSQVGGNTVIQLDLDDSLTLIGVNHLNLTGGDFLLL